MIANHEKQETAWTPFAGRMAGQVMWPALLLLLSATGCVDSSVRWLPDSSGFLFDHGGRVIVYGLAKRATRTVVSTRSEEPASALSPDGKQLVVVVSGGTAEKPTTSMVFYGLDGREIRRSGSVAFRPLRSGAGILGAACWTPAGDHILIHGEDGAAVYDTAKDTFKVIEKVVPMSAFDTPIRPDGKGFLAIHGGPAGHDETLFIDWDGWEYKLAEDNAALKDLDTAQKAHGEEKSPEQMPRTRWEGSKMILSVGAYDVAEFDTEKRVVAARNEGIAALKDKGNALIFAQHTFPGGDTVVRAVTVNKEDMKLEFVQLKQGRSKTLLTVAKSVLLLFPSPDGKAVAVSVVGRTGNKTLRVLLVTDSATDPEVAFELPDPAAKPAGQ